MPRSRWKATTRWLVCARRSRPRGRGASAPSWRRGWRRPVSAPATRQARSRHYGPAWTTRPRVRWSDRLGAGWSSCTRAEAIRTLPRALSSPRPTIPAPAPRRRNARGPWSPPRRFYASGSGCAATPACCSSGRSRSIPGRARRSKAWRRSPWTRAITRAWRRSSNASWRSRPGARSRRRSCSSVWPRSTTGHSGERTARARPTNAR